MLKSQKIKETLKKTKEKRLTQDCRIYELKLSEINSEQKKYLERLFLEAKWFYNDLIQNLKNPEYRTSIKEVKILNKNRLEEIRDIKILRSSMKQCLLKRVKSSLKALSTRKKKGFKIGKLKFKSELNSLPFAKIKILNGRLRISKSIENFKLLGLHQIPENAEFANFNLIRKATGYFVKVTCYSPKEDFIPKNNQIGIDFGIKSDLTLSDGTKINTKVPLSKRIRLEHRRLSKKKKGSKNYFKQKLKLRKAYEKQNQKKRDLKNKIVSHFKYNYSHIGIQNENIQGWKKKFGRQIQQSILGGIICGIKKLPQTSVVDRFFPSTQLCPECGNLKKLRLSERIYSCDCGYSEDRDIHAARNILRESIPPVQRDFKPVEMNATDVEVDKTSTSSIVYETGNKSSSSKKRLKIH
jgi:transposase